MPFDSVWNNFANSGSVNDYMTYKRKKEEKERKIKSSNEGSMTSMK